MKTATLYGMQWTNLQKRILEMLYKIRKLYVYSRRSHKRAPSFNQARSKRGKWDTVDTLLIKLYAYFKYNDIQYLKNIFTSNKEELAKETEVWLNSFKDWNDFLNQNCLHAFVDSNTLIPISMKTGKHRR